MVVCPVCQALLDLNSPIVHYGAGKSWSPLEEHMKKHEHETNEWSRPCQVCVDRGDLFTKVAPEWLREHILSDHKVNGPFSSVPLAQPSVMSPVNGPVSVPQPVQRNQVDLPGPGPAQDVKFWKFVTRPKMSPLVVCPCCLPPLKANLKLENMASHLKRVHKIDQICDWKCQGCKVAVPPDQLVKHIACQPITTSTLKRKAPTDGETGKSTSIAKFGKYTAVQEFPAGKRRVWGPILYDQAT